MFDRLDSNAKATILKVRDELQGVSKRRPPYYRHVVGKFDGRAVRVVFDYEGKTDKVQARTTFRESLQLGHRSDPEEEFAALRKDLDEWDEAGEVARTDGKDDEGP